MASEIERERERERDNESLSGTKRSFVWRLSVSVTLPFLKNSVIYIDRRIRGLIQNPGVGLTATNLVP